MSTFKLASQKPVGRIAIQGAKIALPAIAACLLAEDATCQLNNLPKVQDIITMLRLIAETGAKITIHGTHTASIDSRNCDIGQVSQTLCQQIRGSIVLLGPSLARFKQVVLPHPGGCGFAPRPIDMHIKALEQLGATFEFRDDCLIGRCDQFYGANIEFARATVTGTENVLMAAATAIGTTTLQNPAFDPEVIDLVDMLNKMGANISVNYQDNCITVEGVKRLHGCVHNIIPDRLELGTYMVATTMTGGQVQFDNVNADHNKALIKVLERAGATIDCQGNQLTVMMDAQPQQLILSPVTIQGCQLTCSLN